MSRSTSSSEDGKNDIACAAITKAAIVTALATTPAHSVRAEPFTKGQPMEKILTTTVVHQLTARDKEYQHTKCGLALPHGEGITTGWQSHVTCENCIAVYEGNI